MVAVIKPSISRICRIDKYDITIEAPYSYEEEEDNYENTLINLYNKEKGISINAIDLKEDFWSSGDVADRMNEYLNIISAANYDTGLKNLKTEVMDETGGRIGRVEFELSKNYSEEENMNFNERKLVTLITNEEIGNVVIEISASKENFDKNEEEIETIVRSIKIKK